MTARNRILADAGPLAAHGTQVRTTPPKVLIVEDEMVVAMLIEDMVIELGYEVSGVATQVADAMALLERDSFDLAILDVHLNGKLVFPLAQKLEERGIPFMFATAYGERGIPEYFLRYPVIQKPFSSLDLKRSLVRLNTQA